MRLLRHQHLHHHRYLSTMSGLEVAVPSRWQWNALTSWCVLPNTHYLSLAQQLFHLIVGASDVWNVFRVYL